MLKKFILLILLLYPLSFAKAEQKDKQIEELSPPKMEDFSVSDPDEEEAVVIEKESEETKFKTKNKEAKPAELEEENSAKNYVNTAILQGLNKITARNSLLKASIEQPINFGTLNIIVKLCWRTPQDEKPDSKALIEIWEHKPGEKKQKLFYGWMFASSPSLNGLEHAVYDVVLVDCINH